MFFFFKLSNNINHLHFARYPGNCEIHFLLFSSFCSSHLYVTTILISFDAHGARVDEGRGGGGYFCFPSFALERF